mmetsp:Transcript_109381/g.349016  ORF Transcript_109381/g.349016 Transcript_109381/m.349016 type:complete len:620 (-) Transcript_109381:596-2455(-)
MLASRTEHDDLAVVRGADQRPQPPFSSGGVATPATVDGGSAAVHRRDGAQPCLQARAHEPAARRGRRGGAAAGGTGWQRLLPDGAAVPAQQEQRRAAPGAQAARAADRGEGHPRLGRALGGEYRLQLQGPGLKWHRRGNRRRHGQLGGVDLQAVPEEKAAASAGQRGGGEELVGPRERDRLRDRGRPGLDPQPAGAGHAAAQGQAPERDGGAGHLHEVLPRHAGLVVLRPWPAQGDVPARPGARPGAGLLDLEGLESALAAFALRRLALRRPLQRDELSALRGLPADLASPGVDEVLHGLARVRHVVAEQPPLARGGRGGLARGPPGRLALLPQLLQAPPLGLRELLRVAARPQELLQGLPHALGLEHLRHLDRVLPRLQARHLGSVLRGRAQDVQGAHVAEGHGQLEHADRSRLGEEEHAPREVHHDRQRHQDPCQREALAIEVQAEGNTGEARAQGQQSLHEAHPRPPDKEVNLKEGDGHKDEHDAASPADGTGVLPHGLLILHEPLVGVGHEEVGQRQEQLARAPGQAHPRVGVKGQEGRLLTLEELHVAVQAGRPARAAAAGAPHAVEDVVGPGVRRRARPRYPARRGGDAGAARRGCVVLASGGRATVGGGGAA